MIPSPVFALMHSGVELSGDVEAVEVHDLGPGCDEVLDELFVRVGAGVDFGDSAQFGVGAEDQVDACSRPLDRAGLAVDAFKDFLNVRSRLPSCSCIQ